MAAEVGSAFVTIIPSFRGFGKELARQISDETKGLGDQVGEKIGKDASKGLAQGLKDAGAGVADFGDKLTKGITLPLAGMAAGSFKVFADFDQTMRQVGVQTGLSGEELKRFNDLALKLGQDTSFSAGQAADAMLALAKGGISAAQMEAGALQQTLTLAAAGGLDLGSAAEYMANTLNTFGLGAESANVVAAALAGGANASTASVESLGQALSQVGPGAQLAGLTLNETVAALSLLDNAGVKGSDAGTALKTMLQRLTPQTEAAATAMEELGLNFVDAQGNFLPMRDVAGQLQTAMSGLTEEQKTNALTTIFGADAYRAAAILANEGAAGLDTMTAATEDLSAAEALAKTNTEGAKGSIEQMMGSVETLAITVGQQLAPHIITLAEHVTGLANKFSELSPEQQKTVLSVLALAAAVGPVVSIVGRLTTGLGSVVKGAQMFGGGIVKASLPVRGFVTGLRNGQSGMSAFASTSQRAGSAVARGMSAGLSATATGLRAAGTAALTAGRNMLTFAAGAVRAGIAAAASAAQFVAQRVVMIAGAVATGVMTAAQAALNFVMALNPITLVIIAIVALVAALVIAYQKSETFREIVNAVFGAVKDFVIGAVTAIKDFVVNAWNWIVRQVTTAVDNVKRVVLTVFGAVLSFVVSVNSSIRDAISGAWDKIKSVVSGAINAVKTTVSSGFSLLRGIAQQAWDAVVSVITGVVGRVGSAASSVVEKIKSTLSGAVSTMRNIGGDIVDGVVNGITGAVGRVTAAARKIVESISGPVKKLLGISSPSKVMREFGGNVADGLALGILSGVSDVERATAKLADAATFTTAPLAGVTAAQSVSGFAAPGRAELGNPQLAGGAGRNATINVYPQQGQSEQQIAALVDARLGWAWETA